MTPEICMVTLDAELHAYLLELLTLADPSGEDAQTQAIAAAVKAAAPLQDDPDRTGYALVDLLALCREWRDQLGQGDRPDLDAAIGGAASVMKQVATLAAGRPRTAKTARQAFDRNKADITAKTTAIIKALSQCGERKLSLDIMARGLHDAVWD